MASGWSLIPTGRTSTVCEMISITKLWIMAHNARGRSCIDCPPA